ncbi:MAG: hypothetical protein AB1505_20400 [Candidatus Latescibacterota bacterium]
MGLATDGLIIVSYFVLISAVGLYMGRRERSLHDFALGGRQVPWWAVMASIIAAETSAATFLGAPGEGYEKRSLAYVQLVMGVIIGRFLVGFAFLKPYYRFRVYTVYDYLAIRFGPLTRAYVSGLFLVMRTLASGTRLFVPSLVMVLAWRLFAGENVGFSQGAVTTVTPYVVAILALTVLTCVYTALGGIKAVIWTDLIQACLMFGSALVAIATLLYHVGGLGALLEAVPEMGRTEGYFHSGLEAERVAAWKAAHGLGALGVWDYVKLIVASDYTLFSALNALATSATNDWYIPYCARRSPESAHVRAARLFTVLFAGLMVAIAAAFAYAKVADPSVRIIPVVLGIAGFILGPMLGVFLVGILTRGRGSDRGNAIAVTLGLAATIVCGDLHLLALNGLAHLLGTSLSLQRPEWLPHVSFTWFAMLGAVVVFGVGVLFRTPRPVLEGAAQRARQAESGDERPLALRDG